MSHFTVLVITKHKPTESILTNALAAYEETNDNEQSKWDWWVLGGRWRGMLAPKNGADTLDGEPGVFDNEKARPNGCDAVRKRDLDFERTTAALDGAFGFPTFAVVDKDGEWHERGEMGWFGTSSNDKPANEWRSTFDRLLAETPDDHWLAVVDCHI